MDSKGLLLIVSGYSGAGKGTVVKELVKLKNYSLSISATTRKARDGEKHGEHYYFVDKSEFNSMIDNNELVEWAEYCDNFYGTPKKYVDEMLDSGKDVILEIEMQGALKVKEKFDDSILIFVIPPKIENLRERLLKRGTETIEIINKRLKKACEETCYIEKYDYIVVNDNVNDCKESINSIVIAEKNKVSRHKNIREKLEKEFIELLKGE